MATPIGSLFVEVGANVAGFMSGMDKANKKAGAFGADMAKVGAKIGLAFAGMGIAAGGALLKIGSDFDAATDKIRVGTGATGEALEGLQADLRAVVSTVPTDFGKASTAIADLNTRLGLTGKPLQDMTAQMLNLARVTGTDVATLIASTTRVFGDWGVATQDQAGALDLLFKVSQSTGIGVDALSAKVVQFGAPLRAMGFSLEESTVLLGKWEKEGVNSELVLGSLRIAMGKFAKDGVPMREGLDDTIAKIQKLGPGAEATTVAMEIFGAKAGPDMAAAILEGRFELGALLKQVKGSPETINNAAEATLDWQEKLELLKNRAFIALEPVAARVFEGLGHLIEALTPHIERFVVWFSAWLPGALDAMERAITDLRPFFDILGKALGFIADEVIPRVVAAFQFVRKNWDVIGPAIAAVALAVIVPAMVAWATAAIAAAAATIIALLPVLVPLALIGAAVAALAFAWRENLGDIQGKAEAVLGFLTAAFATFGRFFTDLWNALPGPVQHAIQLIAGPILGLIDIVRGALDWIGRLTGQQANVSVPGAARAPDIMAPAAPPGGLIPGSDRLGRQGLFDPGSGAFISAFHHGGAVPHDMLAFLQGGERVLSRGEVAAAARGGGMTQTIIVEMDGRELAHAVVPFIPGEVQRVVGG